VPITTSRNLVAAEKELQEYDGKYLQILSMAKFNPE
jgi:hypothetical protein